MKLKEMFEEAYERCRNAPMEGVSFTVDDFNDALDKYDFTSEIGSRVRILLFCLSFIVLGWRIFGFFLLLKCQFVF